MRFYRAIFKKKNEKEIAMIRKLKFAFRKLRAIIHSILADFGYMGENIMREIRGNY